MLKKFVLAAAVAVGAIVTAGAAQACPNYSLQAAFGTIRLPGNFAPDPYIRNVTAGGGYYLPNCGFNWTGWVAAAPDFEFNYTGQNLGYPLTIGISSAYDTVILINGPDGTFYFNDDAGGAWGLGAALTFPNPRPGVYDIWIGTYQRGSGLPAQLIITEQ